MTCDGLGCSSCLAPGSGCGWCSSPGRCMQEGSSSCSSSGFLQQEPCEAICDAATTTITFRAGSFEYGSAGNDTESVVYVARDRSCTFLVEWDPYPCAAAQCRFGKLYQVSFTHVSLEGSDTLAVYAPMNEQGLLPDYPNYLITSKNVSTATAAPQVMSTPFGFFQVVLATGATSQSTGFALHTTTVDSGGQANKPFIYATVTIAVVCFLVLIFAKRRLEANHRREQGRSRSTLRGILHGGGSGGEQGRGSFPSIPPGASSQLAPDDLVKLPVSKYTLPVAGRRREKDDGDHDASCCICLADFDVGDEIRSLRCGHLFHRCCVDSWFRLSVTCPTCKREQTGGSYHRMSSSSTAAAALVSRAPLASAPDDLHPLSRSSNGGSGFGGSGIGGSFTSLSATMAPSLSSSTTAFGGGGGGGAFEAEEELDSVSVSHSASGNVTQAPSESAASVASVSVTAVGGGGRGEQRTRARRGVLGGWLSRGSAVMMAENGGEWGDSAAAAAGGGGGAAAGGGDGGVAARAAAEDARV